MNRTAPTVSEHRRLEMRWAQELKAQLPASHTAHPTLDAVIDRNRPLVVAEPISAKPIRTTRSVLVGMALDVASAALGVCALHPTTFLQLVGTIAGGVAAMQLSKVLFDYVRTRA